MWGNPTLFHRAKPIETLRQDKDWQKILTQSIEKSFMIDPVHYF